MSILPSDSNPLIVSSRHFSSPSASSSGFESSYRMIRLLGRGTMASVYLAEQMSMARPVALKILSPALAMDKSFVERFLREARASARLNHPNIVTAIDFGEIDSRFYLAMEFIDGEPLSAMLEREEALDEQRVMVIGRQVISALHHAADHHVVHLDVKPANIMICKDGRVKLADFGLAMLLDAPGAAEASRRAVGTPYYMAPEQVEGGRLDWRSDQYALGASLYEAVTGRKPFQGNSVSDILVKRFFEKPEPAWKAGKRKVSRYFSAVLAKMLSRSPEGRYQSFSDLEKDFDRVISGKKPAVARVSASVGVSAAPSSTSWNTFGYGSVLERIDAIAWSKNRNWILYSSLLFLAVLGIYSTINAKALVGPKTPDLVREDLVALAGNPPPEAYLRDRLEWTRAERSLALAERYDTVEEYQQALLHFKEAAENAKSLYYSAAKQNIEHIEKVLAKKTAAHTAP